MKIVTLGGRNTLEQVAAGMVLWWNFLLNT